MLSNSCVCLSGVLWVVVFLAHLTQTHRYCIHRVGTLVKKCVNANNEMKMWFVVFIYA